VILSIIRKSVLLITLAAGLAACVSGGNRAPVVEHGAQKTPAKKFVPRDKDSRPQTYVVQKGDTLYAIAFNMGMDYHEIIELNNIQNPNVIHLGQELRLSGAAPVSSALTSTAQTAAGEPGTVAAQAASAVPSEPEAQAAAQIMPLEAKPAVTSKALEPATKTSEQPISRSAESLAKPPAASADQSKIAVLDQPKVLKLPYSEEALAEIARMQDAAVKTATAAVKADTKTEPKGESRAEPKPEPVAEIEIDEGDDALEWNVPVNGKIISEFSESANRKGIDFSGKLGQPVLASAAGKVVYSGNGLRGYGKLVIIKHNKTFLSAYAHNDQILVKEGQSVSRGQKIAEMGSSDSDQVKLHFEIRKFGKPVDPSRYLPPPKS
jgi:lipoprotein NlpD